MSTGLHLKPVVVEAASTLLTDMKAAASSLTYAALLTDDGFDVARYPVKTDGERFAGMASSMQALGDAVTHELKIGDSEYIIIASGKGHVVQLRVPGQELRPLGPLRQRRDGRARPRHHPILLAEDGRSARLAMIGRGRRRCRVSADIVVRLTAES